MDRMELLIRIRNGVFWAQTMNCRPALQASGMFLTEAVGRLMLKLEFEKPDNKSAEEEALTAKAIGNFVLSSESPFPIEVHYDFHDPETYNSYRSMPPPPGCPMQ